MFKLCEALWEKKYIFWQDSTKIDKHQYFAATELGHATRL